VKSSIAAALLILQGVINLIISAMFIAIPGMIQSLAEDAPSFLFSLFTVFSAVFVVIGILQVIAGIGVLSAASWSWGFGIGVSILGLFHFPIGTILAIVCLVVLMSSKEELGAEKGARATGERKGNEEWPLILGTIVLVAGILWVLATYVETPYAWALAFGIIGMTLIILDRALRTQTKGLEILGEISLGTGVFLALFVSGISTEYVAVPIIVSGLLIILAYYISKRSRDAGRVIAVLCMAAVLGAACSPLYHSGGSVRVGWDSDWIEGRGYNISETRYFEPKESVSIDNINGAIIVKGWDENRIKLEYIKQASDEFLLDDIKAEVREDAGELAVVTKMPERISSGWVTVDYTLMLPQNSSANLTLNSVSGDISISNAYLSSEVILKTVSGDMKINGVEAESLLAHTTSGDIDARQSGFHELDIETVSGDAEMDMTLAGNARIKTTSGDINLSIPEYDGVRINARTAGGDIDFKVRNIIIERESENEITACIYPIRYHIELETVSGDIEII
jgi:hypothetical protein